jgi:hypothetical protein
MKGTCSLSVFIMRARSHRCSLKIVDQRLNKKYFLVQIFSGFLNVYHNTAYTFGIRTRYSLSKQLTPDWEHSERGYEIMLCWKFVKYCLYLLIDLSCLAAIRATMGRSRELSTEAEYLAWVDLEGRLRGANHLAYPPVIAAGKGFLEARDLLLIDVGIEYHGYSRNCWND